MRRHSNFSNSVPLGVQSACFAAIQSAFWELALDTYTSQAEFFADKAHLQTMLTALDAAHSQLRLDQCRTWTIKGKRGYLSSRLDGLCHLWAGPATSGQMPAERHLPDARRNRIAAATSKAGAGNRPFDGAEPSAATSSAAPRPPYETPWHRRLVAAMSTERKPQRVRLYRVKWLKETFYCDKKSEIREWVEMQRAQYAGFMIKA
jgi:hypothetical protein